MPKNIYTMDRRQLVGHALSSAGVLALNPLLSGCRTTAATPTEETPIAVGARKPLANQFASLGELQEADDNGVRLPKGFTSRIIANSNQPVIDGDSFQWHGTPDGGATFSGADDGWMYLSNSENKDGNGGCSVIAFDKYGEITAAYSVLDGTTRNCSGGVMPWGTWLSAEEYERGQVWEVDPLGKKEAKLWPQLGTFNHEACALDPDTGILYLTEDEPNGGLYRFVPDSYTVGQPVDFDAGELQVLTGELEDDGQLDDGEWVVVPDPLFEGDVPLRKQIETMSLFQGGEGIWHHEGLIYFATKLDNRIYTYNTQNGSVKVLYDASQDYNELSGVDNLTVTHDGQVVVAEDLASDEIAPFTEPQIVAVDQQGKTVVLLEMEGHTFSEITGPAFSPDGSRLYFSSQRGTNGDAQAGMTFEVTGPFFAYADE